MLAAATQEDERVRAEQIEKDGKGIGGRYSFLLHFSITSAVCACLDLYTLLSLLSCKITLPGVM